MVGKLVYSVLLVLGLLYVATAHPIPTFLIKMTDASGKAWDQQYYGGNYTSQKETTLYFYFEDMLHNNKIVTLGEMMEIHNRMIHVLLVSVDNELTAHTHPDDFMAMSSLPNATTLFSVNVTFPRSGAYSIAANFMFNDFANNTYRDGFAQTEFAVSGANPMDKNTTRNYNTTNRYNLWNFTNVEREIFHNWIDTTQNYNPKGYWGELKLSINGTLVDAQNINITQLDCAFFVVTMYSDNDTIGEPAPLLPLMSAPVHFTLVNYDNAVYHSHGMYLPPNTTFQAALKTLSKLSMTQLGAMDPLVDYRYNLSMSASMIGVTPDGYIDCFTDEGKVMYEMDQMAKLMPGMAMDMNEFYGPSQFNVEASIFNFPNPFNWRIYAWMKILDHEGNERLIVPHWDVWVNEAPYNGTTDSSSSMADDSDASTVTFSMLTLLSAFFMF